MSAAFSWTVAHLALPPLRPEPATTMAAQVYGSVLRLASLKRFADVDALSERTGLPSNTVERHMRSAHALGYVQRTRTIDGRWLYAAAPRLDGGE